MGGERDYQYTGDKSSKQDLSFGVDFFLPGTGGNTWVDIEETCTWDNWGDPVVEAGIHLYAFIRCIVMIAFLRHLSG